VTYIAQLLMPSEYDPYTEQCSVLQAIDDGHRRRLFSLCAKRHHDISKPRYGTPLSAQHRGGLTLIPTSDQRCSQGGTWVNAVPPNDIRIRGTVIQ